MNYASGVAAAPIDTASTQPSPALHVYVAATYSDSFTVVDVTNPSQPAIVGGVASDTVNMDSPTAVSISPNGHYAFVVGLLSDSLVMVDVRSDPTHPVIVATLSAGAHPMSPDEVGDASIDLAR